MKKGENFDFFQLLLNLEFNFLFFIFKSLKNHLRWVKNIIKIKIVEIHIS